MYGNAGGRRAAAEALSTFNGVESNQLINKCLQDPDPLVKAAALNLLRPRGISGALATLIKHLDDTHPAVRKAAQQNLPEYTFARFVSSFESLEEGIRTTTGKLVLRADPQAIPSLLQEIRSNSGKRRLRALAIARSMQVCETVEEALLLALEDPDHLVRVEAAISLGECKSRKATEALEQALHDSSLMVQEAAQTSLERAHARQTGMTASVMSQEVVQ
jgi:hypothetical protein